MIGTQAVPCGWDRERSSPWDGWRLAASLGGLQEELGHGLGGPGGASPQVVSSLEPKGVWMFSRRMEKGAGDSGLRVFGVL